MGDWHYLGGNVVVDLDLFRDWSKQMDIQAKLDELLEQNPELQNHVTKLWYVPEGTSPPADCTHVVVLSSTSSTERHITIGLVVVPKTAALVDMILALVATQPGA